MLSRGGLSRGTALLCVLFAAAGLAITAFASPVIDSAVIKSRIWNDDSDSTFSSINLYPSHIQLKDEVLDGDGVDSEWANRHAFRLSDNGGISEAVFNNGDGFELFADVTITGTANAEGGLNFSSWWTKDVDGVMMLNTETGEVACFGARLPFYSFTANDGVTYTKGTTVRQGIIYRPNGLSETDPATIQYFYNDGTQYSSPEIAYDMGNAAEDPPYGLWGNLNDGRLGGYFLPKIVVDDPTNWAQIDFENLTYVPEPTSLLLLGAAGLILVRRR